MEKKKRIVIALGGNALGNTCLLYTSQFLLQHEYDNQLHPVCLLLQVPLSHLRL